MRSQEIGEYQITPEMIQEFQIEAEEHLQSAEQCLIRLSEDPRHEESVHAIFRDMHSIKGTAGYLKLNAISSLAHAAEDLLEVLRRREQVEVSDEELDLLFEALDRLKEMVENPYAEPQKKVENLIERLNRRKSSLKSENKDESVPSRASVDPLSIFLDAADQHISTLKECLARSGEDDAAKLVDIMFRAAHSLKSSSSYMGFQSIEDKASSLEKRLDSVRSGFEELSSGVLSFVSKTVEELESLLEKVEKEGRDTSQQEEVPRGSSERSDVGPDALHKESPSPEAMLTSKKTMRVSQDILDRFMNLVGELIVARNAFGHIERGLELGRIDGGEVLKDLRVASMAVSRISEEMQRAVMEMRMVPIRHVFQKFPRMVRDLGKQTGKQVQVLMQGEETEIDKVIAEELADPLVHVIRNSVDHGIEHPEERKRAGKPEKGTIILKASHEGNFIVIEVIDDGKGIDTDAVLKKAIDAGLVNEEAAASLSEEEILNFIFAPGFSTAQEITDISGRGVGMDVVMTNLQRLKGSVQVFSERGKGTRVRLEVPLTLALIDALLVQVYDHTFAIPVDAIDEAVKVSAFNLRSMMGHKAITLRGEVVPVVLLSELLGIDGSETVSEDEARLLVMRMGAKRLGVMVDRIQRKEEIVVKPLASYLASIPGIAGATILGDGKSVLILDPQELGSLAVGRKGAA